MDLNEKAKSIKPSIIPAKKRAVSVVVPSLNESESLPHLVERLDATARKYNYKMQVIIVDDGSTDDTEIVISKCVPDFINTITYLKFRTNQGKSTALSEGIDRALHDIVITMDADLQDQPEEIPNLISLLDEGCDVVSGWKKRRNDPFFGKKIPSFVFNWLVRRVLGTSLRDINCGLKAYRKEVWNEIGIYGEFHRFIPALAANQGFKIGEIEVEHQPRLQGVSKYGGSRFVKGSLDLLTVLFLNIYKHRPLHFFGSLGGGLGLIGVILGIYLSVLWFMGNPIGTRPLLQLSVLLIIVGVQIVLFGVLSQLQVELFFRTNRENQKVFVVEKNYYGKDN